MTDLAERGTPRIDPAALRRWSSQRASLPLSQASVWLHEAVAGRMRERLALIRLQPTHWLDVGGALGSSVELLRSVYPQAQGSVLEPERSWREQADAAQRRRWWTLRREPAGPAWRDPAENWPQPVQLIWSNMTLHREEDPPAALARWHAALQAGGFVMFSCLGPGSFRELRDLYQRRGWGPATIAFVDMHDLGDMLVAAGFADPVMDQELIALTWSSVPALLSDLRALGRNASPQRHGGLRTPRWRREFVAELERLTDAQGRLRLSVEVAYGHAFKVERPARGAPVTSISVDALRSTARRASPGREGP